MMTKSFKVGPTNSQVNGYPGRHYDWTQFCWDGSAVYLENCGYPKHPVTESRAIMPYKDGMPTPGNCEYIHVPYKWEYRQTVYRVYPRNGLWPGRKYYGKYIVQQRAVLKEDGWYWEIDLGDAPIKTKTPRGSTPGRLAE